MNRYYSFLVPRLNGDRIRNDFARHLSLVKKGVAGFIVFGGRLEPLRRHISRLQEEAALPLMIASDLEQGLGQHVRGGTLFPPAMAVASAIIKGSEKLKVKSEKPKIGSLQSKQAEKIFTVTAEEARYAGINTIFAPVMDINTNPKNPIISVRSFGEDRETVSFFGRAMIETLQRHGIAACAKHFPGHGDTAVDSHIRLPRINKTLRSLRKTELYPFEEAIEAQVKMLMLGHLSVPALDSSGIPVSLSERTVSFIREKLRYDGMLITDAMNMRGIGRFREEKASAMALGAGVDILLHPTDPDRIAAYLEGKKIGCSSLRINRFRMGLSSEPVAARPDFSANAVASRRLAEKAIRLPQGARLKKEICLVILNDEEENRGSILVKRLREKAGRVDVRTFCRTDGQVEPSIPDSASCIVALFSATRAWKGGSGQWLQGWINALKKRADIFISFGSPYLLDGVPEQKRMTVYWDSAAAEDAAGRLLGLLIVSEKSGRSPSF